MIDWAHLIMSNILVATLIGVLAWLIGRSGQRAFLAHLLWVAFFLKLVTPPIVLLPIEVPAAWLPTELIGQPSYVANVELVNSRALVATTLVATDDQPLVVGQPDSAAQSSYAVSFSLVVVCIWGFGFIYHIGRGTLRFWKFQRLLNQQGVMDDEATAFVGSLIANRQPIVRRQAPKVMRIPLRVSPMLFGSLFRTVIVCPDVLWQAFSDDERQAFLAHETAHYVRRDHWVRWLEWVTTAAYWWFPAVYLARTQLQRHEEACCDAWAVQQLRSPPRHYAEALLKAVDFISEQHVGIPRFASGMRHTDCLEERLRFVMLGHNRAVMKTTSRVASFIAISGVLLLHPLVQPVEAVVASTVKLVPSIGGQLSSPDPATLENSDVAGALDADLPTPPVGFWNKSPERQWANFPLTKSGTSVVAEAGNGIRLQLDSGQTLNFTRDNFRAIVDIPSSKRVVIGTEDGSVRLWDLESGLPVSLIGRHSQAVSSAAYYLDFGLVTADTGGSVMRWNMQSGQVLATMSVNASSVQSVRYSTDGNSLAVLTGLWDQPTNQVLHVIDSRSLESIRTSPLAYSAAVVIPSPDDGWLAVDWAGGAWNVDSLAVRGRVPKEQVSALVLTQNQSAKIEGGDFTFGPNSTPLQFEGSVLYGQ